MIMLARPRKNSPARSLCLAALVLGLTAALPVCAAAETLQVSFTVEPYTSLELTESSIAFAPVPPGSSVEQTVQAIVKANVTWELRISGTQSATGPDGSGVMFYSRIYACDFRSVWEDISTVLTRLYTNQPPTDDQGVVVDIPLRFEADFNDPPGTYQTQIQLTLVPII
jgi:hypothetical protein